MVTQRRKFSDEEKLRVLQQAGEQGIANSLREHNISYSVFSRWRRTFLERGIDPIGAKSERKLLLEENARLKKIVADMALSLEMKNEEVKRMTGMSERRI